MLNLPYISMPCYQYNFPTILHCSWVIKQGELNTFSAFSHLRARLKGSYTACLSQAAIKRSLRPGNERRGGGGEVGWSIIARSERNLCVWSRALRMSACQPGNFSSCVWKHMFFFPKIVEETCGCLAPTLGGRIDIYGFIYQTNQFSCICWSL